MGKSKSFIIDMDGVLVKGEELIPGADLFIDKLNSLARSFLVLTNNSERTPRDSRGTILADRPHRRCVKRAAST